MSRIWKQLPDKSPELADKIRRTGAQSVVIPMTGPGAAAPILRMNALPVMSLPRNCLELTFETPKEWADLQAAEVKARNSIICAKGSAIWGWGDEQSLRQAFGMDLKSLAPAPIDDRLHDLANNLQLKGFAERAIGLALVRNRPLLYRTWRGGSVLILDRNNPVPVVTKSIAQCVGELHGRILGMIAESTPEHPRAEEVWWAEAVKLDFEEIDGTHWVLIKPEVWIWPKRARKQAADFLDKRVGGRFNRQSDALLSAWIGLLFPSTERATDHIWHRLVGWKMPAILISW